MGEPRYGFNLPNLLDNDDTNSSLTLFGGGADFGDLDPGTSYSFNDLDKILGNTDKSSSFGTFDFGGGTSEPSFWEKMMGSKEVGTGWLSPITGLANTGLGFWLGYQNLGLGQDTLDESKRQFDEQFSVATDQVDYDIYTEGMRRHNMDSSRPTADEWLDQWSVKD